MLKKILLIIDPQYSFLDNGELPVNGSQYQMDCLSEFISEQGKNYSSIIITVDNHPINHCSFKHNGGMWPTHCVQHSVGASIYEPIFVNSNNVNNRVFVFFDIIKHLVVINYISNKIKKLHICYYSTFCTKNQLTYEKKYVKISVKLMYHLLEPMLMKNFKKIYFAGSKVMRVFDS